MANKKNSGRINARNVKSIDVVDVDQIPAGADVKEGGIELEGAPEDVARVELMARAAGKLIVAIPYLAKGAQGRELEYAVAGIRKHFLYDEYFIVIVGDHHPIVESGEDIGFVVCPQIEEVPEGMYRPHLDHINKILALKEAFPGHRDFVWQADDVYAVNDYDMIDVCFLKAVSKEIENGDPYSENGFKRDKARTKAALLANGRPVHNYTTHLPRYYRMDFIKELIEKYDLTHNSYVLEDLYFNTFFPTKVPFVLSFDKDNLKCGVYRSNPRIWAIEEAFTNKIWINNSPEGWIPELDKLLAEHYGI